jgi:hypothetical protein
MEPGSSVKFCAAIDSAMRVRNSVIVEIALLVFVFTGGVWIWRHQVALDVTSWYASPQGGHIHLTVSGCWFAFISVTVSHEQQQSFQFILLRFICES